MTTIQIGNQDWHTRYALAKAVECQSESPFMVQWMREKIYFHKFQSVDDFEAWQEENGKNKSLRNFFEYFIEEDARRVYFDIEYITQGEGDASVFETVLGELSGYFTEKFGVEVEWRVCTSSGRLERGEKMDFKNSYHVVSGNYYVDNYSVLKVLTEDIRKSIKDEKCIVDYNVYGKAQCFRMLGSTKYVRRGNVYERFKVPLPPAEWTLRKTLVCYTQDCERLDCTDIIVQSLDGVSAPRAKRLRVDELGDTTYAPHFFRTRALLNCIQSDPYAEWVRIGMALKSCGDEYVLLWHEFSSRFGGYDKDETQRKWDSFHPEEISIASLAAIVRETQPMAVDSIFKDAPVVCPYMNTVFSPVYFQSIMDLVTELEVAERLAIQFCESTFAFVYNDAESVYALKCVDQITGGVYMKRVASDVFESELKRHMTFSYKRCAEEVAAAISDKSVKENERMFGSVNLLNLLPRVKNRYDSIVNAPGVPYKEGQLNTFRGYDVLPSGQPMYEPVLSKILFDHIRHVLCGNDTEEVYSFFLKWIYTVACVPGKRTGVCVLLSSGEGTGKNLFTSLLCRIMGSSSICAVESKIFCRFNSILENKALVVINELASTGKAYAHSDMFKTLITDDTLNIEKKGLPTETVKNYLNFILTTNNENVINVTAGDRRFLALRCKEHRVGESYYFKDLADAIEDPMCVQEFVDVLVTQFKDEDPFNASQLPMTEIKKDLQRDNAHPVIGFIDNNRSFFSQYCVLGTSMIPAIELSKIHEAYNNWVTNPKLKKPMQALSRFFHSKLGIANTHRSSLARGQKGPTVIEFGTLDVIENKMRDYYKNPNYIWE